MLSVTNAIFRSTARSGHERDEYLIWGFARHSMYDDDDNTEGLWVPNEIKKVTIQFLGNLNIDSNILTEIDALNCMKYLNQKVNSMQQYHGLLTYNFLYRGSHHGFQGDKFEICCKGKNGMFGRLILIETKYDCIFGAYFANNNSKHTSIRPNIKTKFLFTIRPNIFMKTFETTDNYYDTIDYGLTGFGFGKHPDIHISNNCNKTNKNWIKTPGISFNFGFNGNQLCGGQDLWGDGFHFIVKEIECYEIL